MFPGRVGLIQPGVGLFMFVRRAIGWFLLKITGWEAVGGMPKEGRYVLIAAPHTTNWDMPFMIAISWRLNVKIHWIGKKSLFRFPYGWFMKMLGGISVDRTKRQNTVQQISQWMHKRPNVIVVVPPEGSRSKTPFWKSGFYHIAREANVPIALGFLDYANKRGGFGPSFQPTDNPRADMQYLRDFYQPSMGKYPEKFTVPRLKEEVDTDPNDSSESVRD